MACQDSGCGEKKEEAYICGASPCWTSRSRCKNTFHIPNVSRQCVHGRESLRASVIRTGNAKTCSDLPSPSLLVKPISHTSHLWGFSFV